MSTDFVSVRDPAYGAVGDGVTDDTAAIQAAIDATDGGVFIPSGTYAFSTLTLRDDLRLLGAGRESTTLRTLGPASSGSALLNGASRTGITLDDLTIDGNGDANAGVGLYITGDGWDKLAVVRRCRFQNLTSTTGPGGPMGQAGGIYVWTADGVRIVDCDFVDNNYDVYMDTPGRDCIVVGNRIWSTAEHSGRLGGITLRRSSTDFSGALVAHNTISSTLADPSGQGVYGHAINVVACQGVRVLGNAIDGAIAAGVHVGSGSYGTKVETNTISGAATASAAGIYCELNIGDGLTTLGDDGRPAGCVVRGNTVSGCPGYGIAASYSAATTITDNHVSGCGYEGIFSDSDRCSIAGNHVFDNYTTDNSPDPSSAPDVQAQIRVTVGHGCRISGNQVFHTSAAASPASYAIAVADASHVIDGNVLTGGGGTWGLYQSGTTTNLVGDNIG